MLLIYANSLIREFNFYFQLPSLLSGTQKIDTCAFNANLIQFINVKKKPCITDK